LRKSAELLSQLIEPTKEDVSIFARRAVELYREERDETWFSAVFTLIDKLDRKVTNPISSLKYPAIWFRPGLKPGYPLH